jgi:hypothetical protein
MNVMTETANRYTKDYSKAELIFGNLAIILWIGLGALSCSPFLIKNESSVFTRDSKLLSPTI